MDNEGRISIMSGGFIGRFLAAMAAASALSCAFPAALYAAAKSPKPAAAKADAPKAPRPAANGAKAATELKIPEPPASVGEAKIPEPDKSKIAVPDKSKLVRSVKSFSERMKELNGKKKDKPVKLRKHVVDARVVAWGRDAESAENAALDSARRLVCGNFLCGFRKQIYLRGADQFQRLYPRKLVYGIRNVNGVRARLRARVFFGDDESHRKGEEYSPQKGMGQRKDHDRIGRNSL